MLARWIFWNIESINPVTSKSQQSFQVLLRITLVISFLGFSRPLSPLISKNLDDIVPKHTQHRWRCQELRARWFFDSQSFVLGSIPIMWMLFHLKNLSFPLNNWKIIKPSATGCYHLWCNDVKWHFHNSSLDHSWWQPNPYSMMLCSTFIF